MQDSGKTGKVDGRGEAFRDVNMHSRSFASISHEIENSYLKRVSDYQLLTPEEEQQWTNTYSEARSAWQGLLRKIPMVFKVTFLKTCEKNAPYKLERYYYVNQPHTDENETELEEFVSAIAAKLQAFTSFQSLPPAKMDEFWHSFHPLLFKNSFMNLAMDVFCSMNYSQLQMDESVWLSMKRDIDANFSKMRNAGNLLVERNLRLVLSIAGHYANNRIPLADLVQEGNMGLMKAVERFDCSKGHRFSTYASYWIRQAITKFLTNSSRIIRMPANTVAQISTIKQAEQYLLNKNGIVPTAEDLAPLVNLSPAKIRAMQRMMQQPLSLQNMLNEDTSLEDTIPDPSAIRPGTPSPNNLTELVNKALDILSERERMVISMRFGLNDNKPMTLSEISTIINISSERVRQIENEAIRKLRIPEIMEMLDN